VIDNSKPNQAQLVAIQHTEGPLLIIAGPGSGKTKTLVDRIVHIIGQGTASENIMVATFTEKAAKELITRVTNALIEKDLTVNLNEMYIGTLHGIFLRILEENIEYTRLKRNYRVLDQFDQKYLLFRNINTYIGVEGSELLLGGPLINRWEKAEKLKYYLSMVSEECLEPKSLSTASEIEVKAIGEFALLYSHQLIEENALDFAAIQSETLYLLEHQPEVLIRLHEKLRYLMVDEYQDTNTIQERILLLLAGPANNICVVGDDDQGLYRFRGATIRNILEFPNHFPQGACCQVNLTVNYRSHPNIIRFYNEWMQEQDWTDNGQNFRYDKNIIPSEDVFDDYPAVLKVSSDGDFETYCDEILKFIQDARLRGNLKDYNQIAFLFRSVKNEKVIALAKYLEAQGIPVFSPRSSLFFEREEIQLLLGALIFVFPNLFEDLKWREDASLSTWNIYLGWKAKFADALRANPQKHQPLLQWCQKRAKEHLTLQGGTNYGFAALIYQLLEFPMFSFNLDIGLGENKTNLRAAYNIALLTKLLFKFEYIYNITVLSRKYLQKNLQDLFNTYLRFIMEGGIEEYEDFDEFAPTGCVSFMTIHQSKGLEFPIVFAGSLNANPTRQHDHVDVLLQNKYFHKPPFEPLDKIKFYDFRRLYYTAFSRPKQLLILTAHEKSGQGRNPSKHFDVSYGKAVNWRSPKYNPSEVKYDLVEATNIKKEYSFTSHILLFENCPLQYKFYKELEFTEVRTGGVLGGSLLHQTIEDIHKAVLRKEVSQLTDENITAWFNSNYYLLSKSQRSYLHQSQLDSLLQQILRYRNRQSQKWHLIKAAEVDVSLVKDDYILKGTIDLIEGENGTVELIDFKSGDKPDVNSREEKTRQTLHQYRRQLEVYAHLVEQRTGQKVSKMHLYYPKEDSGSPYITFNSNKDNIAFTIAVFDDVVSNIEKKNYDMSKIIKSEKQCGNCDMRYYCNPKQYSNK
jgi:DNA helicase-2/ATP-dependent DNA helicase PcrA